MSDYVSPLTPDSDWGERGRRLSSPRPDPGMQHNRSDRGVCELHEGRRIVYFCTGHGTYCCVVCRNENHARCRDIAFLKKQRKAVCITQFDATIPGDENVPSICDSAFIPNPHAMPILIDRDNKKVKIFGKDFKFLQGRHFDCKPYHVAVCRDDASEVAVALPERKNIIRLRFQTERPLQRQGVIATEFKAHDITYINPSTLLAVGDGRNLLKYFTTEGAAYYLPEPKAVQIFLQAPCYCCLNETGTRLFISDYDQNIVCALDLDCNDSGETKLAFVYKHAELRGPQGLAVDSDGNIYICGHGSNNIHQVSPLGEHIGILLSEANGIKSPWTISFSPDGETFIVAGGHQNKMVKVFKFGGELKLRGERSQAKHDF